MKEERTRLPQSLLPTRRHEATRCTWPTAQPVGPDKAGRKRVLQGNLLSIPISSPLRDLAACRRRARSDHQIPQRRDEESTTTGLAWCKAARSSLIRQALLVSWTRMFFDSFAE